MASIQLICGPAGSGKTSWLIERYRTEIAEHQADGRFGAGLWITPSKQSRETILRTLLRDDLAVCFSPQVVTFEEFAERLIATAPETIRPLGGIARRRLLREVIDELQVRRQFRHFAEVADTPGFLDLCESFISELKREEVWPEDFEKVCRDATEADRIAVPRKNLELLRIYQAYQQRLHAAGEQIGDRNGLSGLYDYEGRFWTARTLIVRGHRDPFRHVSTIVVDGFTDFTRTQTEMLAGMADWAERMYVTLPADAAGKREELFTKSNEARDALLGAFAGHELQVIRTALTDETSGTPFGQLSAHLFENPRFLSASHNATGLSVLACVRSSGEVETVARRVKQQLVDGASPDEIVVAFRTLDGIADFVQETFTSAGIPTAVEVGPAISATGAVRVLLSLLELEREDWAFPQLTGLLNSTLFRPDWPDPFDGPAAQDIASTLRFLNLDGGREVILAALKRRLQRADEETCDDSNALARSYEALRRLSETTAPLRDRAVYSEWIDHLLHIATALGFVPDDRSRRGDDGKPKSREERGWNAFVRLLEESRKARVIAGGKPRVLSLTDFRRQVLELLSNQRLECADSQTGRVRVLTADRVRNLDVPHLYLCGMSESVFPQSRGDDCLYGEAERLLLRDHGLPLGHRARNARDEMLLFYSVATRFRRSLTLSYPSVDDSGERMYPSPFVTAVRDLFEPDALAVIECGRFDPVPAEPEECVTASDFRVLATREALAGRGQLFATLASNEGTLPTALSIVAAAEMTTARFRTRGLTNYEGVLTDPQNIKRLKIQYGSEHEFSATELEAYAQHPFRYFLKYVLKIDPASTPGPRTDYARRGSLLHGALASSHGELARSNAITSAELAVETLVAELERLVTPGGDSPLQRIFRQIEQEVLQRFAVRYGTRWEKYFSQFEKIWDTPPRPAFFEVPFGNMPEDEGGPETGVNPRVAFGDGDDVVFVRGQIDRIDIGRHEDRPVYTVIDYKLSKEPQKFKLDELSIGDQLQLAIYAIASQRLKLVDADLFQLAYWSLKGDGFLCGISSRERKLRSLQAEEISTLAESLDAVLPEIARSIRSGQFPVVPDDSQAKYNSEVEAVARVTQLKSVVEVLKKIRPGREIPRSVDGDE